MPIGYSKDKGEAEKPPLSSPFLAGGESHPPPLEDRMAWQHQEAALSLETRLPNRAGYWYNHVEYPVSHRERLS